MADYLEPGLVAEAYLHFVEIDYSSQLVERLHTFVYEHAEAIARARFKAEFEVSVKIDPGSLKTKAKVTIATIGTVLLTYGNFRQSVDYAVRDSKWFSDHVIPAVVETVHKLHGVVYRTERRTGIPGRIQQIIHAIEEFRVRPPKTRKAAVARFEDIQRRTQRVFMLASDPKSREVIASGLEAVVAEAAGEPEYPRLPSPAAPALPPDTRMLDEFLDSLRRRRPRGDV